MLRRTRRRRPGKREEEKKKVWTKTPPFSLKRVGREGEAGGEEKT